LFRVKAGVENAVDVIVVAGKVGVAENPRVTAPIVVIGPPVNVRNEFTAAEPLTLT